MSEVFLIVGKLSTYRPYWDGKETTRLPIVAMDGLLLSLFGAMSQCTIILLGVCLFLTSISISITKRPLKLGREHFSLSCHLQPLDCWSARAFPQYMPSATCDVVMYRHDGLFIRDWRVAVIRDRDAGYWMTIPEGVSTWVRDRNKTDCLKQEAEDRAVCVYLSLTRLKTLISGSRISTSTTTEIEGEMASPSAELNAQVVAKSQAVSAETAPSKGSSSSRLDGPLAYSGSLDSFESFDVTKAIGREYPKLQLSTIINDDAKIRDLAITGESN